MGGEGGNPSCCCHFHPQQEMVGVCALCLREKLLQVLASNYPQKTPKKQTKSRIRIGKVFVLPSFFHLSHPSNKFDEEAASASISSLEESFISIKFEENGQASWHSSNTSLPPSGGFVGRTKYGMSSKRTVEHSDEVALRCRDRIGQLALYWKSEKKDPTNRTRTSNNSCYDVKVDERSAKGRKGWMKSITRKRSRTNYKQKGE
ncbi:uncharacterized protein LOC141812056 [Curcuma longa]|uniref:uncharacterized protein LOC141812056 n=1 Tax=Curcuma longa TaxID=136217 RepID=UPI003D9EE79F